MSNKQHMTKKELIELLAKELGETERRTNTILDKTIDLIVSKMIAGDKIPLIGLGTFSVKRVAAKNGVNPRTMEAIVIPEMNRAKFSASAILKRSLNS